MAGRVRNLPRRPGVLAAVGGTAFVLALGLLLWFTRVEREALLRAPTPLDTLALSRRAADLRRLQIRADSVFAAQAVPQRVVVRLPRLSAPTGLPVDSASADTNALIGGGEPVSVVDQAPAAPIANQALPDNGVSTLAARLRRAQNAPLAASWRALAADPLMQQDPRVRVLADSLADAERERNEYDAVGGVDPVYLDLSSRVTAIGRAIEQIAASRIPTMTVAATGGVVQRMGPSMEELRRRFLADSMRYDSLRVQRDQVTQIADTAALLLRGARTEALRRDSSRARAQRRVDALASPGAMLSASLAIALGLALLTGVLLEVRSPRLATDREVATQARVPVLLSIRPTDGSTADALTSAFSQLVFDLEAELRTARTLLIVSDDPQLASRTAARMAERLGYDGRSVRVVSPRMGAARITTRARPRSTPTATQAVLVQPERNRGVAWTGEFVASAIGLETTTLRAGTLDDLRAALVETDREHSEVILVVRIGSTATSWLARARAELQSTRGSRAIGVVVWAAEIEDNDPIAFALDTALQRTQSVTSIPA
jgi:hypothetical protein